MIIACPACNTRYVVPDSAIGLEGRTVRCAKCKHSWFQDGPEATGQVGEEQAPSATTAPVSQPPRQDAENVPPAAFAQGAAAQEEGPSAPAEAPRPKAGGFGTRTVSADERTPDFARAPDFDNADPPYGELPSDRLSGMREPDFADEASQFDYAPPFRPRRNWMRIWTWAAVLFAVFSLGAVAAVNFIGVPGWVPIQRPLFAMAEPDLKLKFPVEEQERRTLANGTEFFGARITVTNEARESRDVPPILIVLRDARERIVYSWEVAPSQKTLAPGETMTINEAITDVPKAAVFADIGWAPR
ncbi:zinc-ribbon domain-containing protein [Qipengyuania spongiae]|uniref:Zinc-ribbon domain-containing protein n=1 Tax=Qipengyuania spongiae TaxID=2909673 RepID=A0ABY5SYH1_9SPHN|nr:zinc-ribbon domain-containing protein [Qipengyuania spongiae]UVI39587.1 zinc-ribbon domain-containing protein [Qipengyuania spongiae]